MSKKIENQSSEELQKLSEKFSARAKAYADKKAAVDKVLRDREEKNQNLQRLQHVIARTNSATDYDIFLIDGSGSMGAGMGIAPFRTAVSSFLRIEKLNTLGLFGDTHGANWDTSVRTLFLGNCPNTGSNLAPSLRDLAVITEAARGTAHIILASDGDLFDRQESFEIISTILNGIKGATLDIVVIKESNYGLTAMENFGLELSRIFPGRVGVKRVSMYDHDIFRDIVSRTTKNNKKPNAPQA